MLFNTVINCADATVQSAPNFICFNNIFIGQGSYVYDKGYLDMGLNIRSINNNLYEISNNIFMNYSADDYLGAIWVNRNIAEGEVRFSHNNFYNNKIDVFFMRGIVENQSAFHVQSSFISGSYRLTENSPLRNAGSKELIHRNHDGNSNTIGIEGGLFYNTVPTAKAILLSKQSQIILDASASSDMQTPSNCLQYRWDYNNDGIFDTDFLLTPAHTVSSVELLGDTIVCWVFDEHFSMNYVKIAKADIKILPSEVELSVSITGDSFCAGSEVNLTPTLVGKFDDDNLFSVELSDASGDFTNATVLEYIYGNTIEASELSIRLPGDLPQGNYKLRLSSSDPPIRGEASNAFIVNASVRPEITITASQQEICEGSDITFEANVQNAGSNRQYQWFVNDQSTGNNSPVYSTNSLQDGDVVKVELTCTGGCFFPAVVLSNEISINVKPKLSPVVEIFISYLDDPQLGEPVDLFAFVENAGEDVKYEWYVNGELQGSSEAFLSVNYYPDTTVKVIVFCNDECLNSPIAEATYTFGDMTGIKSLKIDKFTVYPNPTQGIVKIESEEIIKTVELFDLTGKMILKKHFNQLNPEFSIENYREGNYLLRIITEEGIVVRKIIKL